MICELGCSNGVPTPRERTPIPPTEPPPLAGITSLHNAIRTAAGLLPLVWDPQLAATAQSWADRCVDDDRPRGVLDHNAERSAGHPWYVGENIYAGTAPVSATAALRSWAAEETNYDRSRNRCERGETCGHYTQLVWAATRKLGCALASCPRLKFRFVLVCDYGPGGNTGGAPY
ncbi:MAG: CAP domain-containing protein [Thermoanaerobaculia bacterium]